MPNLLADLIKLSLSERLEFIEFFITASQKEKPTIDSYLADLATV